MAKLRYQGKASLGFIGKRSHCSITNILTNSTCKKSSRMSLSCIVIINTHVTNEHKNILIVKLPLQGKAGIVH